MPVNSSFASSANLSTAFRQPLAQSFLFLMIGLVHGLLAWLGFLLATGPFNLSPIWPAAGFALAAIAVFGYRVVPVLLLADLLANLVGGTSPLASGVQSLANLTGPSLGAFLLHRYVPIGSPRSDHKDMARFLAISGLVVPGVSAALGIGGILGIGGLTPAEAPKALLTWWIGDALGHLIVVPLVVTWLNPIHRGQALTSLRDGLAPLLLIGAASGLAFWQEILWGAALIPDEILFLPFVLWLTVRWGTLGAATGNFFVVGGAISASLAGLGRHGSGSFGDMMGLEGGLLLTTATTLILGSVVSRNRTALQEAEEAAGIRKSLQGLRDVIEQPYVGMLIVDPEGIIRFANEAAANLLNRYPRDLMGSTLGVPSVAGQKTEIEVPRGRDEPAEVEMTENPIQWEGLAVSLVTLHDVTDRNRAERTIRHQAYHDSLTGLGNRVQFEERTEEIIQGARLRQTSFALLFLDLDRFKEVNDTFGHAAGDELLQLIGKRLQEAVRSHDLVARLSGDEFAILLEEMTDRDMALHVAEKLPERLFAPILLRGQWIKLGGTMGLAFFPEDGEDVETLLMRADSAMYAGKEEGRNRIISYIPKHGVTTSRRFQMEQALQWALVNEEFFLAYQPQVAPGDHHWMGVEALLRWQSSDQGLVPPADFIPLLEERGMISEVGEWVFRQAHADLRQWDAAGWKVPRIWVNVAAPQLEGQDLVSRLDRLVQEEGLDPGRFGVELTESEIASDFEHSQKVLSTLRERGFHLAMDDFGTGYSALTFLRRLPFDVVKIDRAFVKEVNEEPRDRQLIRAIIQMAHSLKMTALAEGVETQAQVQRLEEEGCDAMQGFLFAHPMTAGQVLEVRKASG